MYCLSQSTSWQDRGEEGGEMQKGERKASNCLLSPQSPPPFPMLTLVVHRVHAI